MELVNRAWRFWCRLFAPEQWTVTAESRATFSLIFNLRHWSDGARGELGELVRGEYFDFADSDYFVGDDPRAEFLEVLADELRGHFDDRLSVQLQSYGDSLNDCLSVWLADTLNIALDEVEWLKVAEAVLSDFEGQDWWKEGQDEN